MLRLKDIKVTKNISNDEVLNLGCKKYGLDPKKVTKYEVYKKSIDARHKSNIFYNYTIDIDYNGIAHGIDEVKKENISLNNLNTNVTLKRSINPIIVGSGPAGLFAALTFIENGFKPIIIEQGKKVDDRVYDINCFFKTGKLNETSNVQFGEGGAGTFSDGKLTTNTKSPLQKIVLEEFVKFGAPEEILYLNKPHIGTDNLVKIVKAIREYILKNGGKFLYETKFIDFKTKGTNLSQVVLKDLNTGLETKINASKLILAIGHSSRDTFRTLLNRGIFMEKKGFSVGLRIEHKQELINNSQYGKNPNLKLPPADYKLVHHGKTRSCYTFCMCPGGQVIASTSSKNKVVTNGMSMFLRDGENANSALLVDLMPSDFKGNSPLYGIEFQEKIEEKAFTLGGKNYFAPIQKVSDFLKGIKSTSIGKVNATYTPGVTLSNLRDLFPEFINRSLEEGITCFGEKINGFDAPDAILTGPETRSSSPVRIVRDENFESNVKGIYPCGEGAGYAGGIMTSAVDGINTALKVMEEN